MITSFYAIFTLKFGHCNHFTGLVYLQIWTNLFCPSGNVPLLANTVGADPDRTATKANLLTDNNGARGGEGRGGISADNFCSDLT